MARRTKGRRGSVLGILWRRRLLIVTVLFLVGSGVIFWKSIKYLEAYTARIAEMQAEVDKAENGPDVGHYITLRRRLEIEKVEPFFWGLLVLMLFTFGTVLIALIINTMNSSSTDHDRSAKNWEGMMQERREERQRSRPSRKP